MPITKSAKKSLRVSRTKREQNLKTKILLSKALKQVNDKNISETFGIVDKAAKSGVIHKNKAARIKSHLSKKFKTVSKKASKSPVLTPSKQKTKVRKIKAKSAKSKTVAKKKNE